MGRVAACRMPSRGGDRLNPLGDPLLTQWNNFSRRLTAFAIPKDKIPTWGHTLAKARMALPCCNPHSKHVVYHSQERRAAPAVAFSSPGDSEGLG